MNFTENPLLAIWQKLETIEEELKNQKEMLNSKHPISRQGGLELAEEITGYSRSHIRKLANRGELPIISPPYAKLRFDEAMLMEALKNKARKPKEQLTLETKQNYATLKRLRP